MRTFLIIVSVVTMNFANQAFCTEMPVSGDGVFLQDDSANGPKKEFYANGNIMKEYNLQDGKIQGKYRFYDQLGKLVSDQFFINGEPNGYLKTFYSNGQLKYEGSMRPGGDVTGAFKEYYEDGTLKSEGSVSVQMPNVSSKTRQYSQDGKLVSESSSSNGEFDYAITYDDQGRVTSEQKPKQIISYWYERDTGKKHVSINWLPQD